MSSLWHFQGPGTWARLQAPRWPPCPLPQAAGGGVLTASSHLGALGLVVPGFVDTGSWEPPNCDVRSGPQPLPRRRWWPPRALLMPRTPRPGSSAEIGEQPRYLETGGRGAGRPLGPAEHPLLGGGVSVTRRGGCGQSHRPRRPDDQPPSPSVSLKHRRAAPPPGLLW